MLCGWCFARLATGSKSFTKPAVSDRLLSIKTSVSTAGLYRERTVVGMMPMNNRHFVLLILILCRIPALCGAVLPDFDFTNPSGVQDWQATHDISKLRPTPEGL